MSEKHNKDIDVFQTSEQRKSKATESHAISRKTAIKCHVCVCVCIMMLV